MTFWLIWFSFNSANIVMNSKRRHANCFGLFYHALYGAVNETVFTVENNKDLVTHILK